MYIKCDLNYKVIWNKCHLNNMWCIVIKVRNKFKGLFSVLYYSPSSIFLENFENLCQTIDLNDKCFIVGDFNVDMNKKITYGKKLKDLVDLYGLKQIVNYFTRISDNSEIIIDLVLTNDLNISSEPLYFILRFEISVKLNLLQKMFSVGQIIQKNHCYKFY